MSADVPFREPPDDLPGQAKYQVHAAGSTLYRIHSASYSPTEFKDQAADNPFRGGRFDSPAGDYRYMYAARQLGGAVAETLLRDVPLTDVGEPRVIALAALKGRRISRIRLIRPLRFVDLSGSGAHAFGQDTWLTKCDASGYPFTRHWAVKIRQWCPEAAGFRLALTDR